MGAEDEPDSDGGIEQSPDDSSQSLLEQAEHQQSTGFYAHYELSVLLGRGMASTVRKCVSKSVGEAFAVKIVDVTSERQSEVDAQRLLKETIDEVSLLKELQGHAAIIELHDVYRTPTYMFLIFELAPMGELFDVLTKDVTFSEKRAKRYMRQIMSGVEYMHGKHIIHRDMKLENVLVLDVNTVKLTDFGFSVRHMPGDAPLRDLCGTPGYLAPETLHVQMYEGSKGYGGEVDLWACGVMLYTLLAGYAPFYHRRQMIMLRMIQEGKYEFRAEQWESVSEEAKQMISALLCVDPDARLTAKQALAHPYLAVYVMPTEGVSLCHRARFRRAITCVRFLVRLLRSPQLPVTIDRATLRKRPYRDRAVRHATEATVFAIYGHWVNKGFYESRDMLFANRARPRRSTAPPPPCT